MEVARLQATITADDRDFQRKMRGAEARGQTTARSLRNTFSNLKLSLPSIGGGLAGGAGNLGGILNVAGGNILTSILGKVTGGMTDAIQVGVNYNKMLEAQSIAFQTLGQSAADTEKHLADLQALGLKTPFDYQDLVKASITMSAFGFETRSRIDDLRKLADGAAIGAAATGNFAESLQGVILALGQMRATGKLSAEEMNQLINRGLPAWDILAKKIGISVKELRALSDAGKLRGDVAASLLTEGIGQYAAGAGDRLSETILGKESNVRDAFQKRAAQDSKTLTEAYRNSLDSALKELEQGAGQGTTAKIGDTLAKNLEFITDAITGKISSAEFLGALKLTGAQMWESIQQGFTGAITSGSAAAVEAVKGWAGGVIDSAKKALGIQSPSKVFAEIGQDTIAGFTMGLEAGKKKQQQKPVVDVEAMRKRLVEELKKLRDDPKIQAMLRTISFAEGANYNTLFGGGTFGSYEAHPNQRVTAKLGGQEITSTAAGAFQILKRIDDTLSKRLGLSDFSPETQDLKALALMKEKNAIKPLLEGDFATAVERLKRVWASLPDSPFGQPTKKLEDLTEKYNAALEELTGQTMATSTAVNSLTDTIVKVDLAAQNLTVRGGDGAAQQPFGNLGSMTVRAPQSLESLATIPESFKRLSEETTLAKRSMEMLPPPLAQVAQTAPQAASGMEAVTKASQDQIDALMATAGKFGTAASRFDEFKDRMGQNFDDLIGALFEGGDRWKDAAKNVASDFFNTLASEMMLAATNGKYGSIGGLLGGIVGGLFGGIFGGGKAAGGPVRRGRIYLVGEEGPELFAPPRSGEIVPADRTRRMMASRDPRRDLADRREHAMRHHSGIMGKLIMAMRDGAFRSLDTDAIKRRSLGPAGALFGSLAGKRAMGGPVSGGNRYLVGEEGPEMYLPASGSGRADVRNYNITINVPVTAPTGTITPQTQRQIAAQTAQALQAALARNA